MHLPRRCLGREADVVPLLISQRRSFVHPLLHEPSLGTFEARPSSCSENPRFAFCAILYDQDATRVPPVVLAATRNAPPVALLLPADTDDNEGTRTTM